MLRICSLPTLSGRGVTPETRSGESTSCTGKREIHQLSHGKSAPEIFMRGGKYDVHDRLCAGKNVKQRIVHTPEKSNKCYSSVSVPPKISEENTVKIWKSELPEINSTTRLIDDLVTGADIDIKNFYCVTFIGYSGLGYENPALLKERLSSLLNECLKKHPDKQIVVVCGGTRAGIGAVYSLVEENKTFRNRLKCIGIVSEEALKNGGSDLALSKDKIAFVPDPDGSWQTKSSSGYPYMLYPAHKYGGEVISLGGGQIGYDEVKGAQDRGIKTRIFLFRPDHNELQKKLQAGKRFSDLCPVIYHEFGGEKVVS